MRRPLTRPARRGVTLPVVCIMLSAVVGSAALAIDVGRLYYTAAEVQTAADAAALAAARYQQWNTLAGMGGVRGAAQAAAALNRSGGQAVQVLDADVVPVGYDPKTRAVTASSWNTEAYAFTVTAQAAAPGVFSATRTVRRSATAWIANVNGGACVRPLVINYTRFYEEAVTNDERYSSVGAFAPDLNFWNISSTQYASLPGRTYVILPPGVKKHDFAKNKVLNSQGNWEPADLTGGGLPDFQALVGAAEGSATCKAARAAVGDVKAPLYYAKNKEGPTVNAASAGMLSLCNRAAGGRNAYCFNKNGTVGVKVRLVLADSVGDGATTWTFKVREVGVARVMCYFQDTGDECRPRQMNEIAATGWWCYYSRGTACGGPWTGYPEGTMIVFLDTPGSTDITPDLVLGTKPGLTQRLLLAQ